MQNDEPSREIAEETTAQMTENALNASSELRKRRSTRIVQAVPLNVTGVDALGRPFTERTSTLIINCHGCRYQSKHYVLKNMWVTLEIPHSEGGQPARNVRGRVAWIQRPRTVRQLFQVALELEQPGNAWGMAFPPEDWFTFPEASHGATGGSLPGMPAVSGAADASVQLARQMSRLLNDAKQQIHTAARDAAMQAVSAERHAAFEQWEQKFAAARVEVINEAERAVARIQKEADEKAQRVAAAADEHAERTKNELPQAVAPRLHEVANQVAQELAGKLAEQGAAQRAEFEKHAAGTAETLRTLCEQADAAVGKLTAHRETAETQLQEQAHGANRILDEAKRELEERARAFAE